MTGGWTAPDSSFPPVAGELAKFIMTMQEYPPSQRAGSWNVGKMMEQLQSGAGSK